MEKQTDDDGHTCRHAHARAHESDLDNKAASCESSLQMKHPIKIK